MKNGLTYKDFMGQPKGTAIPVTVYMCVDCWAIIDPRYGTSEKDMQCTSCGVVIKKVLNEISYDIAEARDHRLWESRRNPENISPVTIGGVLQPMPKDSGV